MAARKAPARPKQTARRREVSDKTGHHQEVLRADIDGECSSYFLLAPKPRLETLWIAKFCFAQA